MNRKMNSHKNEIIIKSFFCDGYGNSEKEAWESFEKELGKLRDKSTFLYWRSPPLVDSKINFDTNEKIYCVNSRVLISKEEIPGSFKRLNGIPVLVFTDEAHRILNRHLFYKGVIRDA